MKGEIIGIYTRQWSRQFMHVSGACFQDSVKIRNIVRIISCSGTNLKWMAECETLVNSKQVTVNR